MVLEDREMLFCSFTPTPHCTNFPHFHLRRWQVTLVNIKSDGGRRKEKVKLILLSVKRITKPSEMDAECRAVCGFELKGKTHVLFFFFYLIVLKTCMDVGKSVPLSSIHFGKIVLK